MSGDPMSYHICGGSQTLKSQKNCFFVDVDLWILEHLKWQVRRPFPGGKPGIPHRNKGGQGPIIWCVLPARSEKVNNLKQSHYRRVMEVAMSQVFASKCNWRKSLGFCFIAKFLPAPSSRGGKWFRVKGVTSPSLRVLIGTPTGRCW